MGFIQFIAASTLMDAALSLSCLSWNTLLVFSSQDLFLRNGLFFSGAFPSKHPCVSLRVFYCSTECSVLSSRSRMLERYDQVINDTCPL